ncbi:TIR domain-containing protein [Sphingobacterium siyangense]|uniref:TIR domain-containing protein n=1 Tax=Sphingobacterium siyangense TaxID=459529 RepID=UPI001AE66B2F
MKRKCFISYKREDLAYKEYIQNEMDIEMIDKSLDVPVNSVDENYIMSVIRRNHLSDSTVTIFLIGEYSGENRGAYEQRFIKRELQASLYNGKDNTRNGILGIVLPNMYDSIFKGQYYCNKCTGTHNHVQVEEHTIKEFSYNYYLPNTKCSWSEDERYCVLVKWDEFKNLPEEYIEKAFIKRNALIADSVRVYPI